MNKREQDQQALLRRAQMSKMKADLQELELKARYWKAEFEVRYYTLEAEKIQPAYNEYLEAEMAKREQMRKEFLEQHQKNVEAGLVKADQPLPEEVEDGN